MKSIIAELINFTDKEKAEVFAILTVILFCTCAVLLGITWSRGNDVQYFKERIVLMDQRMTGIDKKLHDTQQNLNKTNETAAETRRLLDSEIMRNVEQDKWIEYWKTLPQLPQPKPQLRR
jgi:hypothetical protein